jgi:D-beta-D-heptose 7-phosphate kinase/D-beta-D-heptose 1-phosphate adenosyltransferase
MKKKAIIVSGYFNPIHIGHIDYFKKAKMHADYLFVIVNNDFQRELKGSKEFMTENERLLIDEELSITDKVFLSIDKNRTVSNTIEMIYIKYSNEYDIYFGNGGDQNNQSIPEIDVCKKLKVKLIDGLGDKIQSSSWILNNRK